MKSARPTWQVLLLLVLMIVGVSVAVAADDEEEAKPAEAKSKDILDNLKFRNLGPAVGGGRVAAVAGVPGQPNVYYVGAAGGGVWKTTDGGLSWKAIFEKQPTASIGAIAVAPSNPNLVWVGTGEANPRNDVITGRGVYFSPDGGASWKAMGLENVGQIANVIVHPTNPDIVFVAALGHVWGPNPDRGVYRTTDGGKTWQKVLFVNDRTGASDLVMDAKNPMVLFAGMWEFQRQPWMFTSGGEGSGVYRSSDGGATWTKLTEGLPKPPLGRVGLAIAPSNPHHVYAIVESKKGLLWESTDLGDNWKMVSDRTAISARPFYFSTLYVAPDDERHLYFLSFNLLESLDGGKTTKNIGRGVHPDHHSLWIDPQNPARMIEGNDGGVYLTTDRGNKWRYLDNLPIEQFYQVATDDKSPYMLCGGLQDNNGWCGPSNSLARGGIQGADFFTVVGGDGEYVVPAPGDSPVIYADSQNGYIQRLDTRHGLSRFLRPYLKDVGDYAPAELKYRFNWTSPIAVDARDANTVYIGGNVLFRSTDGGQTWTPISPDLTRNDKEKQKSSGGPINLDLSGAETFGTILSMAVSPVDPKVIWVGTDDGLVQVTRDGGKNWVNVTPNSSMVPEWGRIQQIDASPFAAEVAYFAVDRHQLDDNKPYVFKTANFGKSWTPINKGLPANEPARVVRENPNKRGFLVLGTDTGLYYSSDDGQSWTRIKSNFPTVPIYDLKFVKRTRDLVVASHGRGLFVFDNLTPLEEFTPQIKEASFKLFSTQPANRWVTWNKRGFSSGGYTAPNPPTGAVIDYYLKSELEPTAEQKKKKQTPVKITITDEQGNAVRTFYGPSKAGFNRATWNLMYDPPTKLNFRPEPEESEFFERNIGPPVVPGIYKVAVTVNGQTETQTVKVEMDPRVPMDVAAFRAQTQAALEVRDQLSAVNEAINRLESLHQQIQTVQKLLDSDEAAGKVTNVSYKPVLEQAKALDKKVRDFESRIYNTEAQEQYDSIHYLSRFQDRLEGLFRLVASGYANPPGPLVQQEMAELRGQAEKHLAEFNNLLKTEVAAFNKLALDHGANTLFAGTPIELKAGAAQASGGSK